MILGEIDCGLCTGELIIEGVSLHTPAWCILDSLIPLWTTPNVRGGNVVIPGAAGALAYPRRIDETEWQLRMAISGVVDVAGTEYANYFEGLETNLAYLTANVFDPPAAPTATRAAELHMPSGAVRNADVQLAIKVSTNVGPITRAALAVKIPAGRFV